MNTVPYISVDDVLDTVASTFAPRRLHRSLLIAPQRHRTYARARQLVMWIACTLAGHSQAHVARVFLCDPSTVSTSRDRIDACLRGTDAAAEAVRFALRRAGGGIGIEDDIEAALRHARAGGDSMTTSRPTLTTAAGRALFGTLADHLEHPGRTALPAAVDRDRLRPVYVAGAHIVAAYGVRASCTEGASAALLAYARAIRRAVARREGQAS